MHTAVLRDLREEFHGSEQRPAVCPVGRRQHRAVCPGTSQEGKCLLPQQLLWRCLPVPGTAELSKRRVEARSYVLLGREGSEIRGMT